MESHYTGENLIPGEIEKTPMEVPIRLMGQANFQRSSLTVNNGRYYVDTSPSKVAQSQQANVKLWNVFRKGGTYYIFQVFAKTTTKQTYDIYVGTGFYPTDPNELWLTRVELPSSYIFQRQGKISSRPWCPITRRPVSSPSLWTWAAFRISSKKPPTRR